VFSVIGQLLLRFIPIIEKCWPTYTLFNAATNALFANIKYGATVPCVPAAVNIRVTFPCETNITTLVTMNLFGAKKELIHTCREGVAPYFLYGDSGGDVLAGSLSPRAYSIQSTVNGKRTDPFFFQVGGTCP
jgi:hypothetical protein